jgi:hypothetical protein
MEESSLNILREIKGLRRLEKTYCPVPTLVPSLSTTSDNLPPSLLHGTLPI